jgi:hypothetical protein
MAERLALWVYGVLDAGAPGPPPCVGVDGRHRIELVQADGLVALASRVPRARFDAHGLCRALQQPRTFEALVRAHQDVLREALALGAVVPIGFATVLRDEAAVRALLRRERERLLETLARLRGMTEWSLKAYVEEPRGGGLADDLHARLAASTSAAARLPCGERRLALNAAYLVADADATVFATLVWKLAREHDAAGVALELTGPWPPFHFSA